MAQPIVSWYNLQNDAQVTSWNVGTVDAGTVSDDITFLIWNNRGGTEDVSDMENCTITTKDSSGGNSGELVEDTWIEVRVDSMEETTFTPIGGTVTKSIKAKGTPAGIISGVANSADAEVDKENYAQVTLHANVPAIASAGSVDFLTRVSYQYV